MKALLIVGVILIGLGVLSFAYYASPIRLMLLDAMGQHLHPLVPMMGGAAILIGVAILLAIRPWAAKDKK
jgi:hypothetical protein